MGQPDRQGALVGPSNAGGRPVGHDEADISTQRPSAHPWPPLGAALAGLRGRTWDVPGLWVFVAVGVAYAVGSKLALELADASDLQSVFFIPAGVTVAALLRLPRRQWWIVLVAAAIAELTLDVTTGIAFDESVGFAVANVVEPLVGALVVARLLGVPIDLARRRHVAAFVVGAVLVGPVVGGFVGAMTDVVFGDAFLKTWWQWALGDALGVVLVGSGILVWNSSPDRRTLGSLPGALLVGGAVVVTMLAFLTTDLPVTFVVVVGVVVAGVVFGARAVATSALVVASSIAIGLVIDSDVVIVGVVDSTALVLIKAQLGLFTIAGLVVAAEAFEAQRATRHATEMENEARYRGTFENAGVGMAHMGPTGEWLRVNDRLCEIVGLTREALLDTDYASVVEVDDTSADPAMVRDLESSELDSLSVERRCRRPDGSQVWVGITASAVRMAAGDLDYYILVVEDITARKSAERTLRAQQASERHARERAELVAETIERLEAVDGLDARARLLAELLVARIADYVTVEVAGESVLALAHRDPDLVAALERLRRPDRRRADREREMARAASNGGQLVPELTPEMWKEYAVDAETEALIHRLAPRSHMAVPIELGGNVPGMLVLGRSGADATPFTRNDMVLVHDLARRAGIVLTAAWLREEEHRISVRLQRTLLPDRLVTHPDVAIAARYEAGSAALEVGGDWYDVIERPEGEIVVAVGDVVGHGLDAAAMMGRLRAAFSAYTAHTDRPGRLLTDLDRFAHGPGDADFTTVWCAVLDPASGELRFASAGHPPALVVSEDGRSRWLESGRSVPLCTMLMESRPEGSVVLRPGDLVVLYSDGLVERRKEPLVVGLARLADAVVARRDRPVGEICDALIEVLDDPGHHDDAVVLALRYGPVAADHFRRVFPAWPEQLARIRGSVRAWLSGQDIDERSTADVLLALGEACANAIEHAYADGRPGDVEVVIAEVNTSCLRIRVRDRGAWLTDEGTRGEDRGRGTAIMRAVTMDFARHTGPDGTVVTMRVPVERRDENDETKEHS